MIESTGRRHGGPRRAGTIAAAVMGIGLALGGCASSLHVNQSYDPATSFERYRTFTWAPRPESRTVSIYHDHIKRMITTELAGAGMRPADENADALVGYKVDVAPGKNFPPVLFVEILDGGSTSSVWMGWGEDRFSPPAGEEAAVAYLQQSVTEILSQYPPGDRR